MDTAEHAPTVPGWEVRRELGRGGQATVWLVEDRHGAPAALKVPDRSAAMAADVLRVELDAVGQLRHEHVVRPLGVVHTDRGPGLLSEYHAGGSLGALVRAGGPLPVPQVVTVLVPVAQALHALHEHGVVHGDLSPGNILFTVEGRPAVADLGSARLLGGARGAWGTAGFTAPEREDVLAPVGTEPGTASPGPGPPADVYALAAVGWFALTGRAPARTSARAPLPLVVPDIPPEVVTLLEAGLDEDPRARPSAEQFAAACYRWATAEPVDLYPSAGPEVAMELPTRRRAEPRPARRRRPVLLGAVTAVVLTVAAGAAATVVHTTAGARSETGTEPGPATAPSTAQPTEERGEPTEPGESTTRPTGEYAGTHETAGSGASLGARDLADVAAALGPARAAALSSRDRQDVAVYTLAGSPAREGDLDLVAELRRRDVRYEGLRLQTVIAGPVERSGADAARVPLRMRISPYRIVDGDGRTLDRTGAPSQERLMVDLVRTDAGWRVRRIDAA